MSRQKAIERLEYRCDFLAERIAQGNRGGNPAMGPKTSPEKRIGVSLKS